MAQNLTDSLILNSESMNFYTRINYVFKYVTPVLSIEQYSNVFSPFYVQPDYNHISHGSKATL